MRLKWNVNCTSHSFKEHVGPLRFDQLSINIHYRPLKLQIEIVL